MATASSAARACGASRSASEKMATAGCPCRGTWRAIRMTISPRLAINIVRMSGKRLLCHAREGLTAVTRVLFGGTGVPRGTLGSVRNVGHWRTA